MVSLFYKYLSLLPLGLPSPPVPSQPQLPLAPSLCGGILVHASHLPTAGHVLATDHLRMSVLGPELAWIYSVTASVWMPAWWCVPEQRAGMLGLAGTGGWGSVRRTEAKTVSVHPCTRLKGSASCRHLSRSDACTSPRWR